MDHFLVERRSSHLTVGRNVRRISFLADCCHIKLRNVPTTLNLLFTASISWLSVNTQLYLWINLTSRILHLDHLSFNLTSITALESLGAISNLIDEVRLRIIQTVLSLVSIYLLNSLLNTSHIDHRLLLIIWLSWRNAGISLLLQSLLIGCRLIDNLLCELFLSDSPNSLLWRFFLSHFLNCSLIWPRYPCHVLLHDSLVKSYLSKSWWIRLWMRLWRFCIVLRGSPNYR